MTEAERECFDDLLERVMGELPAHIHRLLDETPVIVEDFPDPEMLLDMGMDPEEESLCGLHWGTPLTERSVEDVPELPESIYLFRTGIVEQAGGWTAGLEEVTREIRITLLHEIGHHFGLEEDDLEELGYA